MNDNFCPAPKFEKIVLGADACEFCEGATREAVNIAKNCGSKLYAVAVVEVNPEFESLAPKAVEDIEREVHGYLESVKRQAIKDGVDFEIIAHRGEEAADHIVAEARRVGADVIILGRRGRKGIKRLLMGSVTANVIGRSPCSVLVVPRLAKVAFKNIVAATDGSAQGDAAAREAIAIARKMGAKLSLIAAERPVAGGFAELSHLVEAAKGQGVQAQTANPAGRPFEAIANYAKEAGADLVVIGSRGRTALQKLLMGSVAERVVGLSPCAVLVVKG